MVVAQMEEGARCLTRCLNLKHPFRTSSHHQIWRWEEVQWQKVREDGARWNLANILRMFLSMKHSISIPIQFFVPKTRVCYEQSAMSFVNLKIASLGVQRRIELLHTHTHTSQSRRSLMELCKYMLERANRISLACAWLWPLPYLFCPLCFIFSHW